MVTVEVEIKEGDKEPDQHLDEGEHIERVTVPLDQLYDKLRGTSSPLPVILFGSSAVCMQLFRKKRARSSTPGKSDISSPFSIMSLTSLRLFHWALGLHWSQRLGIKG